MTVMQIRNVNGNYSYLLELGEWDISDSSYFRLDIGYDWRYPRIYKDYFGANSLMVELLFTKNKLYVDGQPTQWTLDFAKAWQEDITAFETNYFLMRRPD